MLLHYLAKWGNTKITFFTKLDCVTHTMHLLVAFVKETRSSATAEGPRDVLFRFKSCQPLQNCTNKKY